MGGGVGRGVVELSLARSFPFFDFRTEASARERVVPVTALEGKAAALFLREDAPIDCNGTRAVGADDVA